MKFERGQDPKKSMGLGIQDPKRVDSISIVVRDRNIPDTRSAWERRFTKNPQTIFNDRIRGKAVHDLLHLLETNRKFPWDYIFKKYPVVEDYIVNKKFSMSFVLVMEREGDGVGFPELHLGAAVGQFLIYESKVYHMKKSRP